MTIKTINKRIYYSLSYIDIYKKIINKKLKKYINKKLKYNSKKDIYLFKIKIYNKNQIKERLYQE